MFQSTIIVDPKSEIKGKQAFNTYIIKPTIIDRRESIRIKDVQAMLSWCSKTAFQGTAKQVIIEDLHKASDAVPHALLKVLEEPPQATQITMTINRAEAALATIRSRCALHNAIDLNANQLEQLGVYRVEVATQESTITWQALVSKSNQDRTTWFTSFIKSKQDGYEQVLTWQSELAELITTRRAPDQPQAIRHLALLEEVSHAMRQNVLPRLALQYLNLNL